MNEKKEAEKKLNKGLKVIISLHKGSRKASLQMLSTILGTSLKPDRRNQCKKQQQNQLYKYKIKYDSINFSVVINIPDTVK